MPLLEAHDIHKILSDFFPAKNDDFPSTYIEELSELNYFGISTTTQLRGLLSKWAAKIMEIDASPMNPDEIAMHSEDLGKEFVSKRIKADYWYSYPALLRIGLELEFGEAYEKFANKRDRTE